MNNRIKNIIIAATCLATIGTMPFSAKAVNRLFYGKSDTYDFFKEVTGMPEDTFANFKYQKRKQIYKQKGWDKLAGWHFHTPLRDLRRKTTKPFKQRGFFRVLYGTSIQEVVAGTAKYKGQKIDTIDSAIQSASTNMTVEGGMHKRGSRMYKMQKHAVQGETLAVMFPYMSTYLQYIADRSTLDLLKDQPFLKNPGHKEFKANKVEYDKIRIGYIKNTRLAFEADPNTSHNFTHPKSKISFPRLVKTNKTHNYGIIKSFAINLNKYKDIKRKYPKTYGQTVEAAKRVLNAIFEGAVRISHINGAKTVFLTPVGGGAFGNDLQWIYTAIEKIVPYCKQNNMKIYLVIPSKEDRNNRFWKNLE
jgi:hypothetical protein